MSEFIDHSRHVIAELRTRRKEISTRMNEILDAAKKQSRGLTATEKAEFDRIETESLGFADRIEELQEQVRAEEECLPAMRKYFGKKESTTMEKRMTMPGRSSWTVGNEEETYRPDGEHSYFRDLWQARQYSDRSAADRLSRNNQQQADRLNGGQQRALSGNTPGAGGEFVPPLWAEQQFIEFARPGRTTASLVNNEALPAGTDVINLPKIATGTAVGVQAAQNTPVTQQDMTTTAVSSPVVTIAGGQILSLQLLEQSPLNMDAVILGDLAADYAVKLNGQVLGGSGTAGQAMGIVTQPGTNQIAFTSATPSLAGAGGLYSKIAGAVQAVHGARFLPPTAIVMHPRRWAWVISQNDSSNRPYVLPAANGALNALGTAGAVQAQGYVGEMQGLAVYVDAGIPTNLGAGSNQDAIVVLRREDLWLFESHVRAEAFPQTYAQNMSVFVRLYNYVSFQPARFPQSISVIGGTGLVAPTF